MVEGRQTIWMTSVWTQQKWCIFMSATLQAAVHLEQAYTANLQSTKNHPLKSMKQLFQMTQRLITDDWAVQIGNSRTYVFSGPVLCLGSLSDNLAEAWKDRIKWLWWTRHLKDLNRTDGEPMEFEWNIFPGFTTLGILDEIQKMMTKSKCEPEQYKGRIIFMSIYNDIDRRERGSKDNCIAKIFARTLVVFRV